MRRTLATAAAASLALVSLAAPASADHFTSAYTTVDGTRCTSGALASGTGQDLYTDKAKIRTSRSGVETWTCRFSGVEASSMEENGYVDWAPPSRAVRVTSIDNCVDFDDDGTIVAVGDADIMYLPNGKVFITCTLVPVGS